MERSEPSLVPEWLKSSGSLTGSGTATRPLSPLSSNSDDHAVSKPARNKPSANNSDYDLGRSSASDRTSSSYFRRSSSSNGSTHLRSYSSFGRSQRSGRDWEKHVYESRDKDERDHLDSLGNIYPSRFEKDGLKRSQSMISGKHGEGLPRKTYTDGTSPRNNAIEGNSTLNKVDSTSSTQKAAFERDFPSLGSEDRLSAPEIGRVPSPILGTNVHGLPTSAVMAGDKWISALAEVPALVGNNATGSSGPQTSASSTTSLVLNSTTGLKMADAVAQGSQRTHLAPQLSAGTQRLEELVIKQSKQLIPVTPPMPKALVLSSSDKVKPKAGQQQLPTSSSSLLSPTFRSGPVKTDFPKTGPSGKMIVLKTTRERNGTAPAAKDSLSPTKNTKVANSSLTVVSPVGGLSASRGLTNTPLSPGGDWKHAPTVLEKRPSSQAQSRNDFFNLVRKKSMAASISVPDPGCDPASSSSSFKAGEQDIIISPTTPQGRDVTLTGSPKRCESTETKGSLTCNCNALEGDRCLENGRNHLSSSPIFSEEEEAAFLRSLGWEENADEDGLTEEEIDAFLNKHLNSKPFLKYRKE